MASPGDQQLQDWFTRALSGDQEAYRCFLEHVASYLRRVLRNEDVVQDVLLLIHRKRDLYRPGMPVLPWVRVIAKHRAIDLARAEERRPELIPLDREPAAAAREHLPEIEDLLAPLPHKQRDILRMAKVDELSYAEIAARTGMSIAAIKVAVHRSLAALRKGTSRE